MGQFEVLQGEVQGDPLGRGYSGMTNQAVLDSLVAVDRDNWVSLSAAEIFEAIDLGELNALQNSDKARVDRVLGLSGEIVTAPGGKARSEMVSVFGGGNVTIGNLAALANRPVSRAQELGLVGYLNLERIGAAR